MDDDENVVYIERQPLTQVSFDEIYRRPEFKRSLWESVKEKCSSSRNNIWLQISTLFPIVRVLRYYDIRRNLPTDILAGVATGLFYIPHSLAFGMLSSTRVENGLYTSIWPVLIYALLGTSKHASVGTSAVICIYSAGIIDRQSKNFQDSYLMTSPAMNTTWENVPKFMNYKENISSNVALLTGLILLLIGFLRFRFIIHLLSEPFMKAFTSGAAIHITVQQIAIMFGIENKNHGGIFKVGYMMKDLLSKFTAVKGPTLLVAISSIIILLILKEIINKRYKEKLPVPIPAELFVVILAVIVSPITTLYREVAVVGKIVSTVSEPAVPDLSGCQYYILDCVILSIIICANNNAISKTLEKKHNYEVDYQQEMFAHGMSNFVGGFFKCFPAAFSYERSRMLSLMNVKSTLVGVFVALLMLIVLTISSYIFESLPKATLSAIIVVSMKGLLIQTADCRKLWRINKFEFVIWIFTFLAVVFLDLNFGFLLGVVISLITIVVQTQRSSGYRIGKTIEDKILVEHKKYRDSMETTGVKIFRFHSNLYYANAEIFRNNLYRKTVNPRKLLKYLKKLERKRIKKLKSNKNLPLKELISEQYISEQNNKDENGRRISSSSQDRHIHKHVSDGNLITIISDIPPIVIEYTDSVSMNSAGSSTLTRQVSESPSIISTATTATDDGEEVDPDDGQSYVTARKFEKMRKVSHIIIDCSTINYMDVTGAKMLGQISTEYGNANIKLLISGCCSDIQKTMLHAGVFDNIPKDNIFIDLYDALVVAKCSQRPKFYASNDQLEVPKNGKY